MSSMSENNECSIIVCREFGPVWIKCSGRSDLAFRKPLRKYHAREFSELTRFSWKGLRSRTVKNDSDTLIWPGPESDNRLYFHPDHMYNQLGFIYGGSRCLIQVISRMRRHKRRE